MKLPLALLLLIPFAGTAAIPTPTKGATRLKDLISIEGIRENQLVGYGVVVGLNATGDKRQTVFSAQSLSNVLERMGITVSPTALRVANTAAVMLTATLPAFAQPGTRIDVTASAVGDASNLQGGILLMTSLLAANGQVYAVAQGPVVTGGFVAGKGGTNQTVNHPTVGRVPNGATIEQAAPSIAPTSIIRLQLRSADFATSARIADAINEHLGKTIHIAQAENSALISVETPAEWKGRMTEFIASIEDLRVAVDAVAKVVVNERTGTIVMGKDVRVSPVAILHGNLTIEIQTTFQVSQPNPLTTGATARSRRSALPPAISSRSCKTFAPPEPSMPNWRLSNVWFSKTRFSKSRSSKFRRYQTPRSRNSQTRCRRPRF